MLLLLFSFCFNEKCKDSFHVLEFPDYLSAPRPTKLLFRDGIQQPQNDLVTRFLSLSFVVALKDKVSFHPVANLCSPLHHAALQLFETRWWIFFFCHPAPLCQDPLADLSKSCSSHATSFGEQFLATGHLSPACVFSGIFLTCLSHSCASC